MRTAWREDSAAVTLQKKPPSESFIVLSVKTTTVQARPGTSTVSFLFPCPSASRSGRRARGDRPSASRSSNDRRRDELGARFRRAATVHTMSQRQASGAAVGRRLPSSVWLVPAAPLFQPRYGSLSAAWAARVAVGHCHGHRRLSVAAVSLSPPIRGLVRLFDFWVRGCDCACLVEM